MNVIKFDDEEMLEWIVKDKGQVIIGDKGWFPTMMLKDDAFGTRGPQKEEEEKKEEQ